MNNNLNRRRNQSPRRQQILKTAAKTRRRRMLLEQLEERSMMAIFNVTANVADGAPGSLRAAINAANTNNQDDTINLEAGTYVLTQWLSLTESNKSITFQGDTANNTIVDANHTGRVFGAGWGVIASFNDLTIKNGGSVSDRPSGAGIYGYNSTITINDCIITENQGFEGGGVHNSPGTLTISNSQITDNLSSRSGAGVYAEGTVTISNSKVSGNANSVYDGGGMYFANAAVSLTNVEVSNNTAARDGGGVGVQSSTLAISGGKFSNNKAGSNGGGLYLLNPTAAVGITGLTIDGNEASASGGGFYRGGGSATVTFTDSTISGNSAKSTNSSLGAGGGLFSYQPMTLNRSTVSGNTASSRGGGIYNYNAALTLTNSTLSGNSAGEGGGIYLLNGNTTSSVLNSTLAYNSSTGAGGGLFIGGYSTIAFKNTILAGSSAGSGNSPDIGGYSEYYINSQANNLFSLSSISPFLTGAKSNDQIGVDPQLAALANNGGLTKTHALLSNSPAIDKGTTAGAPSVDQRNQSRPQDGNNSGTAEFDIGAFEYQPAAPPPVANNDTYTTNEDTLLTVSAPGVLLNDNGSSLTTFDLQTSGSNGTVKLNADGSFTYDPTLNFSGPATFTYRVSNGSQQSADVATVAINVIEVNDQPVANGDSFQINEDTCLNLITESVLDNDSDVETDKHQLQASLYFDMPEEQPPPGLTFNSTGKFSYVAPDNYFGTVTFKYVVSDGELTSEPATVTITVLPVADHPVAVSDEYSLLEDETLTVTAPGLLDNDFDPDPGSQLSVDIATLTPPEKGLVTVNPNGSLTYTPEPDKNGLFTFSYRVTDGEFFSEVVSVNLTVSPVNDPPTAFDDSYSTDEDTPLQISASGVLMNDVDPDEGDLLSTSSATITSAKGATVTIGSDGAFQYDPTSSKSLQNLEAGETLDDTFSYTVSDSQGLTDTGTVTITVTGKTEDPTFNPDSYTLNEDEALEVEAPGFLSNDNGTDWAVLSATVVNQPQHGSLQYKSDGSFTYMPNSNKHGSDQFSYTATDGTVTSGLISVSLTINPINDPPLLGTDELATTSRLVLDLPAPGLLNNDTDPDEGDTISVIPGVYSSSLGATVVISANGAMTYDPRGVQAFANLQAGEVQTDWLLYTVRDASNAQEETTITVTVTGVDNNVVSVADQYLVDEDSTLLVPASEGVLDNDYPWGTLSAVQVPGTENGPDHGTLTLNGNGSFTYVPESNFSGTDFFTYIASSADGTSENTRVTIRVLPGNDPPTWENIDDIYVDQGAPTTLLHLENYVIDVDNSASDFSFDVTADHPELVAFYVLPGTSSLSIVPTSGATGAVQFTVTVSDPQGAAASTTFEYHIAASNRPPEYRGPHVIEVQEGASPVTLTLPLLFVDDHDSSQALSYQLFGASASLVGVTYDTLTDTATLNWVSNAVGSTTLTLQATDTANATGSREITLRVLPLNRAPILNMGSPIEITEGESADIPILASDPNQDNLSFELIPGGPTWLTLVGSHLHVEPGYTDGDKVWNAVLRVSDDDDPSSTYTQVLAFHVNDKDRFTKSYESGSQPDTLIEITEGDSAQLVLTWDRDETTGDPDQEDRPTFTYVPTYRIEGPVADWRPTWQEPLLNAKFHPRGSADGKPAGILDLTTTELDGGNQYAFTLYGYDNHRYSSDDGKFIYKTFVVTVHEKHELPTVEFRAVHNTGGDGVATVEEGKTLRFEVVGLDPDRPGVHVPITFTDLNGAGASFSGGVFQFNPTESQGGGQFQFHFLAADEHFTGPENPGRTITVTVIDTNLDPYFTPAFPTPLKLHMGDTAEFTVSADDDDLPEQLLTFSAVGDADPSLSLSTYPVVEAIPTNQAKVTWTPDDHEKAITYRTEITVTDDQGGKDTLAVPVSFGKQYMIWEEGPPLSCTAIDMPPGSPPPPSVPAYFYAPISQDDSFTENHTDLPIVGNVLGNDEFDTYEREFAIDDPDNLGIELDGSFSYFPTGDIVGEKTFRYRIRNQFDMCLWDANGYHVPFVDEGIGNWAHVTITVTNQPPSAAPLTYTVVEGGRITITKEEEGLLSGASDPDGDDVDVYAVRQRNHETPRDPDALTNLIGETGTFTYTAGDAGVDRWQQKVTDGFGIDGVSEEWTDVTFKILDARVDVDVDLNGRYGIENHDEAWEDTPNAWSAAQVVKDRDPVQVNLWRGVAEIPEDWSWPNGESKTQELPHFIPSGTLLDGFSLELSYETKYLELRNGETVYPPGTYSFVDGVPQMYVNGETITLPDSAQMYGLWPGVTDVSLAFNSPFGGQRDFDKVDVRVIDLELIVDANNDNGTAIPTFNSADVAAKLAGEAKRFAAFDADADADEIPDYADGFDLGGISNSRDNGTNLIPTFVPLVVRVSQSIETDLATLSFTYTGGDPRYTDRRGPGFPDYAEDAYSVGPRPGIRLYYLDEPRGDWSTSDLDTWFVVPNVDYPLAEFPIQTTDDDYRYYVFYMEGTSASKVELTASVDALDDDWVGGDVDYDTIKTVVEQIDLDVDSDNNDGLNGNWPRTDFEDNIEDSAADPTSGAERPGKWVRLNDSDLDFDNNIDYFDGYANAGEGAGGTIASNKAGFVPLVLSKFKSLKRHDEDTLRFKIDYPASNPAESRLDEMGNIVPAAGILRIWKKNASQERDGRPANNTLTPGDYIAPGEYTQEQLGEGDEIILWIEAVDHPAQSISIRIDARSDSAGYSSSDWAVHDEVRVSVLTADLDTDSDNSSRHAFPDHAVYEDWIENKSSLPGKIVVINGGDADRDGLIDFMDGYNVDGGVQPNHDDVLPAPLELFTPVVLQIPPSVDPTNARFRFFYDGSDPAAVQINPITGRIDLPGGIMRLWNRSSGSARSKRAANQEAPGNYIAPWTPAAPNVYSLAQLLGGPVTGPVGAIALWVEGIIANTGAGMGRIRVEVDSDGVYALGDGPSSGISGGTLSSTLESSPAESWELFDEIRMTLVDEISVVASNKYLLESPYQYVGAQPGEYNPPPPEADDVLDKGGFVFSRREGNVNGRVEVFFKIITDLGDQLQAATIGDDYTLDAVTDANLRFVGNGIYAITIPSGSSSVQLTVTPKQDTEREWDENIRIKIVEREDWHDLVRAIGTGSPPNLTYPNYPPRPYYAISTALAMDEAILFDNDITGINTLGGMINRNVDAESTGLTQEAIDNGTVAVDVSQGHVTLTLPIFMAGALPTYRGDDNTHPIASIETTFPSDLGAPTAIKANLTFGGIAGATATFAIPDGWQTEQTVRFVMTGNDQVERALRTGHYEIDIRFTAEYGSTTRTRTVRSGTEIINRSDDKLGETHFGDRWWLDDLDMLVPGDGQNTSRTASEIFAGSDGLKYVAEDLNLRPLAENSNTQLSPTGEQLKPYSGSRLATQGAASETGFALIRGDNSSAWFRTYVDGVIPSSRIVGSKSPSQFTTSELAGWRRSTENKTQYFSAAGLRNEETKVTYSFSDLYKDQMYQVLINWQAGPNRATNAPYTIRDAVEVGASSATKTILVNQQFVPSELVNNGKNWRSLGFFVPVDGLLNLDVSTLIPNLGFADGEVAIGEVILVSGWDFVTPKGSVSELNYNPTADGNTEDKQPAFTLRGKYGNRYEFDQQGLLGSTVDRNFNRVEYSYNDRRLTQVIEQGGLTTKYKYDSSSHLNQVVDFADRTTDVAIWDGELVSFTSPAPESGKSRPLTSFEFTAGRLSQVTDAGANITVVTYDPATDRAKSVRNADSYTWKLTPYNLDGIAVAAGDHGKVRLPAARNIETAVVVDNGPLLEARAKYEDPRSVVNDDGTGSPYYWYYQVDNYGLPTAYSKPAYDVAWQGHSNNSVWKWERDKHGLTTKAIQPAGGGGDRDAGQQLGELETMFEYDAKLNLAKAKYADNAGGAWDETWIYNPLNSQLTEHNQALGYYTKYELSLDGRGNVETLEEGQTGQGSRKTAFSYTNRPTSVGARPGGLILSSTIAVGDSKAPTGDEVTTLTDYSNATNRLDLVSTITYAAGTAAQASVAFTYDKYRNPETSLDELQHVTTYKYDLLDRLTKTIASDPGTSQHQGAVTELEYDLLGNRTAMYLSERAGGASDKSNKYTWDYDAMNRVELETTPAPGTEGSATSGTTTKYLYDPNGNLKLSDLNDAFAVTNYKYDRRNQLIQEKLPQPSYSVAGIDIPAQSTARPTIETRYDELGNLRWVSDPRNLQEALSANLIRTRFLYDKLGRQIETIGPDAPDEGHTAAHIKTEYDDLGRVKATLAPGSDENGAAIVETKYEYDFLSRLKATHHPFAEAADGVFRSLVQQNSYDLRDNLTSVELLSDNNSKTTSLGIKTTNYYDLRDRLVATDGPDPSGTATGLSTIYALDDVGSVRGKLTYGGSVDLSEARINGRALTQSELQSLAGESKFANARFSRSDTDDLGRVTHSVGWDSDGKGPQLPVDTYTTYDALNHAVQTKVAFTDKNGLQSLVTDVDYTVLGQPWKVRGPENDKGERSEQITTYDFRGLATSTKVRNLLTTQQPDQATWATTTYDYDQLARLYKTSTEEKLKSYSFADAAGNSVYTIDANGVEAFYSYGGANQLIEQSKWVADRINGAADSKLATMYAYNANGTVRSVRNNVTGDSGKSESEFDALGRLTKSTQFNGKVAEVTRFGYDVLNNRVELTDANNNVTRFTFDNLGRQTADVQVFPGAVEKARTFQYDAFGNLEKATDRENRSVIYTYNNNGSRVSERWLNGNNQNPVYQATFDVSPLGEMTSATSKEASRDPDEPHRYLDQDGTPVLASTSTYQFEYDKQRNLESSNRTLPSLLGSKSFQFNYDYDLLGQLVARNFKIDTDSIYDTTIKRDLLGRVREYKEVAGTTLTSSGVVSFGAEKKVEQLYEGTRPHTIWRSENGEAVATTFHIYVFADPGASHKTNQLISLAHDIDGLGGWPAGVFEPFERYEYGYDAQGRIAKIESHINPDRIYSLDPEGQLTQATASAGQTNYGYDKTGNQGEVEPHNRIMHDAFNSYQYDDEGNVITRISYDTEIRRGVDAENIELETFTGSVRFTVPTGDAASFTVGTYRIVLPPLELVTSSPVGESLDVSFTVFGSSLEIESTTLAVTRVGTGTYILEQKIIPFTVTNAFSGRVQVQIAVPSAAGQELVTVTGTASIDSKGKIYSYAWDHYNRLAAVTTQTRKSTEFGGNYSIDYVYTYSYDALGQLINRTVQEWETLAGGVNQRKVFEPGTQEFANKADEIYLMEAGVPLLQFDGNQRITRHTFSGNLAALDQLFAIEDFNPVDDSNPHGPTTADRLIWTFADHQGTIQDLYVHTPQGEEPAEGDYPVVGQTDVVRNKYEHLTYDPFGARIGYSGALNELYLHDMVSFGYEGNNYDQAAGGYLAGGNLYEPEAGRLMSPAGSGVNPYIYAGNSPVDRSAGGTGPRPDDISDSVGTYSHYLDPREGWNGNTEDKLFAVGKFAAWGVAIVAGTAASMMAAGVGTVYAGGVYLATQAGWAAGETAIEGSIAYGTGSEFNAVSSFGKNFAVNSSTAGIGSGVKWGNRITRYAARQGAEIAADTTYDVTVNDSDFGTALAINTAASLGFDGLGAGVGYGAWKFANAAAGRSTVAYAGGFLEGTLSYRPRVIHAYADVVGLSALGPAVGVIQAGHAAGIRAANTAYRRGWQRAFGSTSADFGIPEGHAFQNWFDTVDVGELDHLYSIASARDILKDRLRHGGGDHEWLMVARGNTFRRWGKTYNDIVTLTTPTKSTNFLDSAGVSHPHSPSNPVASAAHADILKLIDTSKSYNQFVRKLRAWSFTNLPNGVADLPAGLR